jgi:hypothetical protein
MITEDESRETRLKENPPESKSFKKQKKQNIG